MNSEQTNDREESGKPTQRNQSELIELLGACKNFWCKQYECKGKYYDKCRDYTP